MKITKVNIPKSIEAPDGLEDIIMDRLGSVVLLAGKNGSGKTRILEKVFSTLNSKPKKTQIEKAEERLETLYESQAFYTANLRDVEHELSLAPNLDIQRTLETQVEAIKKIYHDDCLRFMRGNQSKTGILLKPTSYLIITLY